RAIRIVLAALTIDRVGPTVLSGFLMIFSMVDMLSLASIDGFRTNPAGCSKRSSSKAAGSMAAEAYPLGYVAGRHAAENEAGRRFQRHATVSTMLPKNCRCNIRSCAWRAS